MMGGVGSKGGQWNDGGTMTLGWLDNWGTCRGSNSETLSIHSSLTSTESTNTFFCLG